ncbi:cysteinyl-tRNA synthetase [Tieghemostelium lacteum]|uniref:cysteine--tRNA ligase n=1 Tax=Tieghemostelium lacteum TaxID=361077 RepID=A0A151Z960_TIELA|nr:cysteinyl-tRNA synthetase [Tieghemostelium lacteum]|eukprot:KYQ90490.1 cysteinyl-tRNA synthetase [Tieghemostelium lacteum]
MIKINGLLRFSSWNTPIGKPSGIIVKNSLVKNKKVPLIIENKSNGDVTCSTNATKNNDYISWYTCGPTVYSNTHIGHARNYMSVDIIQRLLRDYFGYSLIHVMGMTDVDDKIIQKSQLENKSTTEISKHYENEFISNMKALGIQPPMFTTRVTEHMQEIIEYIKTIREGGYSYQTKQGTITFDVGKLGLKQYNKLRQTNENSRSDETLVDQSKKTPQDFVLWKPVKMEQDVDGIGNQVAWDSQDLGRGRPGWHIECSAMIHSIFKDRLDIHSGGIDLEFPHHQNEIAQCNAHFHSKNQSTSAGEDSYQWANYFLHIGHLSISGQKMSKSLKNFISVDEYLQRHSATSLRWMCLLNKYNEPIDYNENVIEQCQIKESKFKQFLENNQQRLDQTFSSTISKQNNFKNSQALLNHFQKVQLDVHYHLCNDFDTPNAIESLLSLIKLTNEYQSQIDNDLLYHINQYISSKLNVFGFQYNNNSNTISTNTETKENEFLIEKLLDVRSHLRDLLKSKEIWDNPKELKKKLYQLTDDIRDSCHNEIGLKVNDVNSSQTNKPYQIERTNK